MATYNMEELKAIVGQNLLTLRRSSELTQSQLAAKLNYSDKSISKWECGDAIPDLAVLKQLADMYGVTIDYLLTPNSGVNMPTIQEKKRGKHAIVIVLSTLLVWLVATIGFISLSSIPNLSFLPWFVFLLAVPISCLVIFILAWVWKFTAILYIFLGGFLWTTLLNLFLLVNYYLDAPNAWMIFLVGVPLQAMEVFWIFLRIKARPKNASSEETQVQQNIEDSNEKD